MNEDLKNEQYELEGKSELLTEADEKFSIAVATILSLGNNAYQIFQSSKVETKREILHILLSNLKLQDRKISYTLRKPYDYIKSLNKKIPSKTEGIAIGDPNEIRTRVTALRGPCPRPLDDGTICFNNGTPLRYLISLRSFQFPRSIRYSEELANKNNNTLLFLLSVPRPLDDGTT